MKIKSFLAVSSLAATVVLAQGQPATSVAAKSPDGKTLVVPAAEQSKGTVYYALTDRDRQVYFESNAPLENIKGQSNKVIGFAVASSATPGALAAGEWRLPVTSMKTGIDLRDEHLASEDWLNAKANPDVIFKVKETKDIKEIKKTDAFASYTATLVGDLTLHGVTKPVTIPGSTITMLKASEATKKVAKGDLVAIRSKFTVTLADYGVKHPIIGEKVAKDVSLDVSLYLSTLPPEKQDAPAKAK